MALALDLSSISPELDVEIRKTCMIKPASSQYNEDPQPVSCFAVNHLENSAYVPLGAWRHFLDEFPNHVYPKTKVKFTKTLYTLETDPKACRDQNVVVEEALTRLKTEHSVFIAAPPGFGKTTLGNYFTAYFKLKTAVICHIDKVNEQWVEEYETHSTAKVQRVKGNVALDPAADVYVFGVQKAATFARKDLAHIGLVIFDEAHIATITAFSKTLLRFQPKYVIGLSATPRRPDGMHKMLFMYFGPKKTFIVREEVKDFTVYKVETAYQPSIKYNMYQGKSSLDWTHLINSIAYNEDRQNYIVSLILQHPGHRIMVLSDREQECDGICSKLQDAKEKSVVKITGTTSRKKINTAEYRVLVAGIKKAGVGFNDPTLTMLILATDRKNVEQLEGRIRTSNNIIYDLVDNYSTLETHWKKRAAWYSKRGAVIETISFRPDKSASSIPLQRMVKPIEKT